MLEDALLRNYYHTSDGKPDPFFHNLGDCLAKSAYFFLRDLINDQQDILKVYIDDFTFSLYYGQSNVLEKLTVNYIGHPLYYFKKTVEEYIENNAEKALELLKKLLDQGNIVFTGTFMKMMPFYKSYTIEPAVFDPKIEYKHRFLTLSYQKDCFYYVEDYENLNKQSYVPFEENYNIGVLKEEELRNGFNYFARIEVFMPEPDKLKEIDVQFMNTIDKTINGYFQPESIAPDGSRVIQGRKAIEEFIKICEAENLSLSVPLAGSYLLDRIERVADLTCSRKTILIDLLSQHNGSNHFQKLIEALNSNIKSWLVLKYTARKEYLKKNLVMGTVLKNCFNNLLMAEDAFFQALVDERDKLGILCR